MKQMGYVDAEKKAFELTMIHVSRAYAAEIRDLGFQPSLDKLIEARIFNVNREQINGLKALGITELPLRELVEFRIFDVNPDDIREMRVCPIFPSTRWSRCESIRPRRSSPRKWPASATPT